MPGLRFDHRLLRVLFVVSRRGNAINDVFAMCTLMCNVCRVEANVSRGRMRIEWSEYTS